MLFDFEYSVFKVLSPLDQDQSGIKLGTEHVIYKKLANFM